MKLETVDVSQCRNLEGWSGLAGGGGVAGGRGMSVGGGVVGRGLGMTNGWTPTLAEKRRNVRFIAVADGSFRK